MGVYLRILSRRAQRKSMKRIKTVAVDDAADEDHGLPSDPLPGFKKATTVGNAPKQIKTSSFQETLEEHCPDSRDASARPTDTKEHLKRQADACFSKVMLCTIAISLVWMSSLGVARFVVQSAITSPPFSVVRFECMRGWDKMTSEKEGHTICTSVQARAETRGPGPISCTPPFQTPSCPSHATDSPDLLRWGSVMPHSEPLPPTRLRGRRRRVISSIGCCTAWTRWGSGAQQRTCAS